MDNFTFYSPTYFAFGKGTENDAGKYVRQFGGTLYDGDFWDFYTGTPIEKALPVGTVLTIAAAGSEGSPNSVITNDVEVYPASSRLMRKTVRIYTG